MKKWLYELIYRVPFVPISWIFGSDTELARLVESGRIRPGRTIDLGCGIGVQAIYLAKNGFDVIGVDFSATAINRARANAQAEGVQTSFLEDDLTNLHQISGVFDLLVDYGALNDLNQDDRNLYIQNMLPLTRPGSQYFLMCFEQHLPTAEVALRFNPYFDIETVRRKPERGWTSREIAIYLMLRK